jgi:hypothetical protein
MPRVGQRIHRIKRTVSGEIPISARDTYFLFSFAGIIERKILPPHYIPLPSLRDI